MTRADIIYNLTVSNLMEIYLKMVCCHYSIDIVNLHLG